MSPTPEKNITPWVPLPKEIAKQLLSNVSGRFNEAEAYLSVLLDADSNKMVTVSGYAKQWRWSRSKVDRYLEKKGVSIVRPQSTYKLQNQRGKLVVQHNASRENEQIKLFIFSNLENK